MNHRSATTVRLGALTAIISIAAFTTSVARAGDGSTEVLPAPSEAARQAVEHDPAYEFAAGGILVTEPPIVGPPAPLPTSDGATDEGEVAEAVSHSEAFSLHSKPGADRVIFLDLDGHTVSGTAWNSGRADPIPVGSYSKEPAGSENESFSSAELSAIHEIWQRVSEDFAPWDVDVTTEYPGEDALRKNGSGDQQYGVHVVITHDSGWYAPSGGVAYIGSFGSTYYSPAFVFSNHLAQGSAKSVAEAASHEVGHALGLLHDGQSAHTNGSGQPVGSSSYYSGHGDWAPIMGVGYGREITQWSKGEYTAANNAGEDDLDEIDGYLPGRGPSTETPLPSADSTTTATLETGGGTDTYLLDVGGSANVSVRQSGPGGNLLAELIVTNQASGSSIVRTISPPADPYEWSHSVDGLGAGSYRIQVRSIGYGSGTSGFSTYASIGTYVLEVDHSGPSAPPPTTEPPGTDSPDAPDPESPEPKNDPNLVSSTSPSRLLDTRQAGAAGRPGAGDQLRIPVAGFAGVPGDAVAAILNVVAVGPTSNGYLSVTPCTDVAPSDRTSSLNFTAGKNIANSTIATLADNGDICIFSSAPTDVVVDVTGSIGPSGSVGLGDTTVRRLVDTRNGTGLSGRLGQDRRIEIFFDDVLHPDTTAIALNLTAISPAGTGFVTLDDCGSGTGQTAALNYSAGENRGNNGVFALSERQSLCFGNTAPLDLTMDLTGQFQPDGLTFLPAEPVRVLDTRSSSTLAARSSLSYDIPSAGGEAVSAASVNIASAGHPRAGYVTSWGCGPMPESSALNPVAGQVTANGALVAVDASGSSCLFHSAGGELIVDLSGWWI